ncbi:hypothetical protein KEB97_004257 [Salmonella enterica]|nr:hypothetical protein [Salmonella enterica]
MLERMLQHQNENEATISVSVKGVNASAGQAMKEISAFRGINQSALMREMLNGPMSSLIRVFIQKSALVASLDQEIAVFTGGSVVIGASAGGWDPRIDQAWLNLLNIGYESDLTGVLLQNAPYLQLRASQCISRNTTIYTGAAMYCALFSELAARDDRIIEEAWSQIVCYWGQSYRRQDYYAHINQLRAARGLPAANPLTDAEAVGMFCRVDIMPEEQACSGIRPVLIALNNGNALQSLNENTFRGFGMPEVHGHFVIPDPAYTDIYQQPGKIATLGFRFRENTAVLYCHSIPVTMITDPVSLSEVARMYADAIDERLRPLAAQLQPLYIAGN